MRPTRALASVGAIPLLLVPSSRMTMYLFAAIFGLGLGGEYLIIPLMAGELFGVKVLGRVMGIILTADGVAEAITVRLHMDGSGAPSLGLSPREMEVLRIICEGRTDRGSV